MSETFENSVDALTPEMYESLAMLMKKPGRKYNLIIKGGHSLHRALFDLFSSVWKHEIIPKEWQNSTLVQLPKTSSRVNSLDLMRFIHCKSQVTKFYGLIVINQAKDTLISNMSRYQIASKPGHRASEHLFMVKSAMALLEQRKDAAIFKAWDLKKFFDSEALEDVMRELYNSNIKGKVYRMIFKMNENIRVRVKTPVGMTDYANTGMGVGQGSIDGAINSAVSIDNPVAEEFADIEDNDSNVNHVLAKFFKPLDIFHPIIFMDDLSKVSPDIKTAQEANKKMSKIIDRKLLSFNYDKSYCMVIGHSGARKKLLKKLEESPLTLSGRKMKCVTHLKYLGQEVSGTLSESVQLTVKKRIGLAAHSVFEIRSVIDDVRANVLGGLLLAFMLWKSALLPMLLAGAECWVGVKTRTLSELEKLQLKMLRVCLAVGKGVPKAHLYAQTGTWTIANQVLLLKLKFLHHIATLEVGNLARDLYEAQVEQNLPGLVAEMQPFLEEFRVQDITVYSKQQRKRFLEERTHQRNVQDILKMAQTCKYKVNQSTFQNDDFRMKSYFKELPTHSARYKFKLISHMLPLAMNYRRQKNFRDRNFLCFGCNGQPRPVSTDSQPETAPGPNPPPFLPADVFLPEQEQDEGRESESHLVRCWAYSDLKWAGMDFSRDQDLIKYFRRVFERRAELME